MLCLIFPGCGVLCASLFFCFEWQLLCTCNYSNCCKYTLELLTIVWYSCSLVATGTTHALHTVAYFLYDLIRTYNHLAIYIKTATFRENALISVTNKRKIFLISCHQRLVNVFVMQYVERNSLSLPVKSDVSSSK